MNAPNFIVATHVAATSADRADLAFARLGALAQDEGGTLAAIGRLCGRPEILGHLADLDALHRDPAGDDASVIADVVQILGRLRDALAAIPTRAEVTGVILEGDRPLLPNLDAAIRYAGARVEEHRLAMRQLQR